MVDGMEPTTTHMNTITTATRIAAFKHECHLRGYDLPEAENEIHVDGNRVTFDGCTVWVIAETEPAAAAIKDDADSFTFKGVTWFTCPA